MDDPGSDHLYLLALGSNMRHVQMGSPRQIIDTAYARLDGAPGQVVARSRTLRSAPIGPSLRQYANGACLYLTQLEPRALLRELKSIESEFGRKSGGQRWRARVLDLDIILWSGGAYADKALLIPHPEYETRDFVLRPAMQIAGDWRDPIGGLSIRQAHARLTIRRPLPR
ncbi:2-amino-4-hydroxy-6-hydroxymethyldihydropteridine diphosphokinase [Croceicoccus mobilis]|uniref:2-amino-4-hydroxy-6-hydroxymethyldihydropteridine pyrophosphokinase n=1 Tax=Croceicoccus mobilis TaxID=1703339 RepID=A0A917DQT5_9SPHN|nr:2-amino-4-hydroxy-6-hydroxymethyldihydropteridine diphosphokinase [Croceicoccus mobilis]GGD57758.1 2-amino-4-hydroxy-6-hydroxymethyldihydropteridine diphosphokinase [Croceicoccus mobilis]